MDETLYFEDDGRVAAQDGVRRTRSIQTGEEVLLEGQVLEDGLEHERRAGDALLEVGRERDAADNRVDIRAQVEMLVRQRGQASVTHGLVYNRSMDEHTADSLLELAERAGSGLRGLDLPALLDSLEARYGDLLAAMHWFLDTGRPDDALRIAIALAPFWMATQRLADGCAWFDRALGAPGSTESLRGQALFQAGLLMFWTGDDAQASVLHEQALAIGRRLADPTITAQALSGLARVALRTDVAEAGRLGREALAVTAGTTDRSGRSNALHVLGVTAQMAGDLYEARALMLERLALMREQGNFAGISSEASNLSMVERQLGNLDQAEALSREALSIAQQRADAWMLPYMLNGLAAIATARGALERAATIIGAAEAMMVAQGAAWPPDERPQYEHVVASLTDAMGKAAFERVRAAGHAMASDEAVAFALDDGADDG